MACYTPLKAYFAKDRNPSGKRSLVFDASKSFSGVPMEVACGQCIGCRLERAKAWATRCMHEKKLHTESAFLTLTYSEKCLPAGGSLVKRDLQLFMKRLRLLRPNGIRFFACGEYGTETRRPHYHVLLLNTMFRDQKKWKRSNGTADLFVSAELKGLWSMGDHYLGEVNDKTCAYVARYCTKVVTGDNASNHYGKREKEFIVMSRRPGIGMEWYIRHGRESYMHDNCVVNGNVSKLPKYYDTKFECFDPQWMDMLKKERRRKAVLNKADNTPERRRVRARFDELKLERFSKRNGV